MKNVSISIIGTVTPAVTMICSISVKSGTIRIDIPVLVSSVIAKVIMFKMILFIMLKGYFLLASMNAKISLKINERMDNMTVSVMISNKKCDGDIN